MAELACVVVAFGIADDGRLREKVSGLGDAGAEASDKDVLVVNVVAVGDDGHDAPAPDGLDALGGDDAADALPRRDEALSDKRGDGGLGNADGDIQEIGPLDDGREDDPGLELAGGDGVADAVGQLVGKAARSGSFDFEWDVLGGPFLVFAHG